MEFCFHITHCSRTLVLLTEIVSKIDHVSLFDILEEGVSC